MSTSTSKSQPKASTAPEPRLAVDLRGERRELFMSFGLLNELATIVGGPEAVPNMSFDANISQQVLIVILAKRTPNGAMIIPAEDEPPIIPVDLSPQIAESILDWASEHVLDFFVRRFAKSATLFASRAGQLGEVGSSLTSTKTSAGKTS